MSGSIPASLIVQVSPGVISAGGTALDLNGLMLTTNPRVPIGSVLSFPNTLAVTNYFGVGSTESAQAAVYFNGPDNSLKKPGALLFSQYAAVAVPAYLRSGGGLTLAAVKALASGTLTIPVNGVAQVSAAINLSGATSLSNAATIIQGAFTSPPFTVSYDSVAGAFVFTNSVTGPSSTIGLATGTLAAGLQLTSATAAVTSQGVAADAPAVAMARVTNATMNWAAFTTLFDPDGGTGHAIKDLFAAWTLAQGKRFAYIAWDTDLSPTVGAAPASFGAVSTSIDGVVAISAPINGASAASFILGYAASLDYTRTNGRTTAAFRTQSGLAADVTSSAVATNLAANGYSYIGNFATANQAFTFFYNGAVDGQFKYLDSYLNQIWLNNQLQLAMVTLLTTARSIPYNPAGYALIRAGAASVIQQAGNFGVFVPGVTLSALQIAEVNALAGFPIDATLASQGYYLLIAPTPAQVRAARGSPPITFIYVDGQSVQSINLASIEVI